MMLPTPLKTITDRLDEYLKLRDFPRDPSNNGLQVESSASVSRVVAGVDACQELIDAAIAARADLILVHHGLSWGAEPRRFTGIVAKRLRALLANGVSLYACHLPLDAHPKIGNNAILSDLCGLEDRQMFLEYAGTLIGITGVLPAPLAPEAIQEMYHARLPQPSKLFRAGSAPRKIRRIAVCSGGGGLDGVEAAAAAGCELFITGEMQHEMYHPAKEANLDVLALGHYASETTGIMALLAHLEQEFNLEGQFINLESQL